jgi:VIT family protein
VCSGRWTGLVTNIALVAGVGGGGADRQTIILTGMAGLVAGAFSMALGEFASVDTQNDALAQEVRVERAEISQHPEGEMAELTDMYVQMGLTRPTAEAVAREVHADPDLAVKVHITQELGVDPDDQPSPWTAAVSSFLAFSVGGIFPAGLVPARIVVAPDRARGRSGRAVRGGRDHILVHDALVVAVGPAAADVRRDRGGRDVPGRHGDRRGGDVTERHSRPTRLDERAVRSTFDRPEAEAGGASG